MVTRANLANMVALPTPVVSDEGNGPRNGSAMPAVLEQSVPTPDPERNDEVAQKPVAGIRWTLEEERILCRAIEAGKTPSEVSKLLDRTRAAITGKIYGLNQEGWHPKALRKRRSIADLYDEDTKENFTVTDAPLNPHGKTRAPKRRSRSSLATQPAASAASAASSPVPGLGIQQGQCILCHQPEEEDLFECRTCDSRYHAKCLSVITDVNMLPDGSWTCLTCGPIADAAAKHASAAIGLLTLVDGQLVAALAGVRRAKAGFMEELRQVYQPTQEVINLKRELSTTRSELQESRKRSKEMENALQEAKRSVRGTQRNDDLLNGV